MHLNGDSGARFIPNANLGTTQAVDIGTSGQYANGSAHLFNPRVDGTTGYLKVDGIQTLDTATNALIPADGTISLGIRGQNGDYRLNGDIGEVLIYSRALTQSERGQVEYYLSTKWGVSTRELELVQTGGEWGVRNVAAYSAGGRPFADKNLPGYHSYDKLNDEVYGNASSWIGSETEAAYAGVAFDQAYTIDAIAFGRSNTDSHDDRDEGTYVLQYTLASLDGYTDLELQDPLIMSTLPWATISSITYTSTFPDDTPHLRHLYHFDLIEGVTAIRILVDPTIAIDELEAYAVPEPAGLTLLLLGALLAVPTCRRRR